MIRKAVFSDISQIEEIYSKILTQEESGLTNNGWIRNVYPTSKTAKEYMRRDSLFVFEKENRVIACVCLDKNMPPEYKNVAFNCAEDDRAMTLHTLAVHPDFQGCGIGGKFLAFYEEYALKNGCVFLRVDTNRTNLAAQNFYLKNGFVKVGETPLFCKGIPNLCVVCFEKDLRGKTS